MPTPKLPCSSPCLAAGAAVNRQVYALARDKQWNSKYSIQIGNTKDIEVRPDKPLKSLLLDHSAAACPPASMGSSPFGSNKFPAAQLAMHPAQTCIGSVVLAPPPLCPWHPHCCALRAPHCCAVAEPSYSVLDSNS